MLRQTFSGLSTAQKLTRDFQLQCDYIQHTPSVCACACVENRESSLTCHRGGSLHQMSRRHKAGSRLCRWWSVPPRSPHTADQRSLTDTNTDRCSHHTHPDPKCPHHCCCSYKGPLGGWMRMLQWKGETRKRIIINGVYKQGQESNSNQHKPCDWLSDI